MVRGFVYLIALLLYSEDKECEDETRAKRTEATTVQESKTRQKKERREKSGLSMTTRDGEVAGCQKTLNRLPIRTNSYR